MISLTSFSVSCVTVQSPPYLDEHGFPDKGAPIKRVTEFSETIVSKNPTRTRMLTVLKEQRYIHCILHTNARFMPTISNGDRYAFLDSELS